MNKIIVLGTLIALIIVGCSDSDDPASSGGDGSGGGTATFTEGTYSISDAVMYASEDCSGTAIAGMCTTNESATSEADCPAGMCMDGSGIDESSCTEGAWLTGLCVDGESGDMMMQYSSSNTCVAAGGTWMTLGWMPLVDLFTAMEGESATFENGIFSIGGTQVGTYTVDGTTITILESECHCMTEDCTAADAATDEASCSAASGEWETETLYATVNSNGSITLEMSDAAECDCNDDTPDCPAAEATTDEDSCSAASGEWQVAECFAITVAP